MYDPVKDGVAKTVKSVIYESRPHVALGDLVHCFWELRTETELAGDLTLHAMPDADDSRPRSPSFVEHW